MEARIDTAIVTSENGEQFIRQYAYAYSPDNDECLIKDERHVHDIVKELVEDGSQIRFGMPKDNDQVLFRIFIKVSNTHKGFSTYKVDFQKFQTCPTYVATAMMGVYYEVKKTVRNARKLYLKRRKK